MATTPIKKLNCKVCGSPDTVKDGLIKGVQRWECKACGRKFLDNGAFPGMKTPFIQAAMALRMHYEGMSLNSIRKQLQRDFHENHSRSSIFKWTNIYPARVLEAVKNSQPRVGDTWVMVETGLVLCGQQFWMADLVDLGTLFLLATVLSPGRTRGRIKFLMEKAIEKAGNFPKRLLTDTVTPELKQLFQQTEVAVGQTVEHLHQVFQERSCQMSGLKSIERANQFIIGWHVHYNYFRRQETMGGTSHENQS